jgi:hypothetical protein
MPNEMRTLPKLTRSSRFRAIWTTLLRVLDLARRLFTKWSIEASLSSLAHFRISMLAVVLTT